MDNAIRQQYLEAMGIDVWVARHPPVAASFAATLPQPAEPAALEHASAEKNDATPPDFTTSTVQPDSSQTASPSEHPLPPIEHQQPWHELQTEVAACQGCPLCHSRTQTVFGVGNKHADWMLIGEAPGQNEDLQGEPFVGRAGQLLNEMLRAIGLSREQVYIANILKCRPPNNRDPQSHEVAACQDFLQRQIELLQPKIILAVGRIAAHNLLNTQQPLSRLRGIRHQYQQMPLVVVPHPAYLLRSLTEKAKAWEDLQLALSIHQSQQQ